MYHSVCQRMEKQGKIDDGIQLLDSGILNLLQAGQTGSAKDLISRRMALTIKLPSLPPAAAAADVVSHEQKLFQIVHDFPIKTQLEITYFKESVRILTSNHKNPSSLHHAIASKFFKAGLYYDAEEHFIYGPIDSAKAVAHMSWKIGSSVHRNYYYLCD